MIGRINSLTGKFSNKKLSFGTTYSSYKSEEYGCLVGNITEMFRDDLNWTALTDYISKDGKPKKIYCYACSDGSEPYSIAMALILRLGFEGAKKYFPIIARDIDEEVISSAQKGIIEFNRYDLKRMRRNNIKPLAFFDYKSSYYKSPCKRGIYAVKGNLRDCVDFKVGDIIKDSESIDYDNAVIFFRNVWMYIPENLQKKLVSTFNQRFKDSTAIVVGGIDFGPSVDKIPQKHKIPVYIDAFNKQV